MAEDKPGLHIDLDWKKQAQEEKKRLEEEEKKRADERAAAAAAPAAPAGVPGGAGGASSQATTQGGARAAGRMRVFLRATSLGGVESLVEHRASTEGASTVSAPDLLRFSIGLEDVEDLWDDLRDALATD